MIPMAHTLTRHFLSHTVGLDRTEHMSFLTGQDRTLKFAGQVLPDQTKSGLIISNFFCLLL